MSIANTALVDETGNSINYSNPLPVSTTFTDDTGNSITVSPDNPFPTYNNSVVQDGGFFGTWNDGDPYLGGGFTTVQGFVAGPSSGPPSHFPPTVRAVSAEFPLPVSLSNATVLVNTTSVAATMQFSSPASDPTQVFYTVASDQPLPVTLSGGVVGDAVPANGSYTSYNDGSGNLVGVSPSTPLPITPIIAYDDGVGGAVNVSLAQPLPVLGHRITLLEATPTITANSAYPAGAVVGGQSLLGNNLTGKIQTITLASNSLQSTIFHLYLFCDTPGGTLTDFNVPSSVTAIDTTFLAGHFVLSSPNNGLGISIYTLNDVNCYFSTLPGITQNLYAVLTCESSPTFVNTNDIVLTLTMVS